MALHLDDTELYFFNEGLSTAAYQALGCHSRTGEHGEHLYRFAVWAPAALAVSVVGDFNGWKPEADPMHLVGTTGVWEGFLGLVKPGQLYKYAILTANGGLIYKADPYAIETEPNGTASVVAELPDFQWTDGDYLKSIPEARTSAVSIYEVHAGSWKRGMTYRDMAEELVDYCVDMGYTHIEFMPLTEYPYDPSWGYQVTGYYAATARYGTPEDLMYLIDSAHAKGIGVILDWVPAHFPLDDHGLKFFDGSCCYEHFDPRRREMPKWGTFLFNFSRTQVHSFLLSSAIFWLREYHVDGLRVDAASAMLYRNFGKANGEWVANRYGGCEDTGAITFLRKLNKAVAGLPGHKMMFAEESAGFPHVTGGSRDGGLGFTFKWNLGWMHDTLDYFSTDSFFRKWNHDRITMPMSYAFSESFTLPLSHDEVVYGKKSLISKLPGDYEQKFAQLRLLYAYQYAMPGKKLMFMGDEFAQFNEWRFDEELDWILLGYEKHQGMQDMVRTLNHIYREMPALYEVDDSFKGFTWLQADDSRHSVIAFQRTDRDGHIVVCVMNFAATPWHGYSIGVTLGGTYREAFNTDDPAFGGTGRFRNDTLESAESPLGAYRNTLSMNLPPFGAVYMVYDGSMDQGDSYYYDYRG